MEDFSQAKTIWSLAEWEPDEVKRQSLASEAIVKLERALSTPLDKQMQAACHNIAGQCHVKLGQESEARASFESALKANKHMRQAQAQLDRVNARSAAKARAEKSARQKRNRQMYCCYVFPRCSRGPCKPEVVSVQQYSMRSHAAQWHATVLCRRTSVDQLMQNCDRRRTC